MAYSYSSGLAFVTNSEPSIFMAFGKNFVAPLFVGSLIDISVTKFLGSQHCSMSKEGVNSCNLGGTSIPGLHREFIRVCIQLGILLFLIYSYTSSPMFTKEHISILGSAAFLIAQSDFFEDFRRMINSILFKINYTN